MGHHHHPHYYNDARIHAGLVTCNVPVNGDHKRIRNKVGRGHMKCLNECDWGGKIFCIIWMDGKNETSTEKKELTGLFGILQMITVW